MKVSNRLARRLSIRLKVFNAGSAAGWEPATRHTGKSALRKTRLIASTSCEVRVATIGGVLEARGQISLVAIPLLLWSALQFLGMLIRTTNRLWHSPTYNWWRLPFKGLGLFGIMVSAVLIGILLLGVAPVFRKWLTTQLGFADWMFALIFRLIPWLILFYGLIMIYRLAPQPGHPVFRSLARCAVPLAAPVWRHSAAGARGVSRHNPWSGYTP